MAFQKITVAPPDARLTSESGTVVSYPTLVDLTSPTYPSVAHLQQSGAAKRQVTHTVEDKPAAAPALNTLSLKDPIYDVPTSSENNTDLFAIENSDKDQ